MLLHICALQKHYLSENLHMCLPSLLITYHIATVDQEIFAALIFSVLIFHVSNFSHLGIRPKKFNCKNSIYGTSDL